MTQTLQLTGSVKSPAVDGVGMPRGCSIGELDAAFSLQLEPIIQEFDRVLGGRFVLAAQTPTPAFVPMPLANEMTTVSVLVIVLEQDSAPITVFLGATPASAGAFVVTSDLVLTLSALPGNQLWVECTGPTALKIIVAGT